MKIYLLYFIINILFYIFASNAFCLSLIPASNNGYIGCSITRIEYPANQLKKELISGLPVRVSVTVSLFRDKTVVVKKGIIITVTYDLWDELFNLEMISNTEVIKKVFKSIELLINDLNNIKVKKIKSLGELDLHANYVLEGTVVLNPVKKEKIKQIQKMVAETGTTYRNIDTNNRFSSPIGYGENDGDFLSTGPRFKKLFDKLFEQYTNEDEEIGLWKTSGSSSPFTREFITGDIPSEK
jgi:hypothetical protein